MTAQDQENMNETFKIHRFRFTKDNIDQFHSIDKRVGSDRFNEELEWLENEIKDFLKNGSKDYPERYDLTVFVYDHTKEPWLLTDGSHREQALRKMLKGGEIDHFDGILLPDILIPRHDGFDNQQQAYQAISQQSKELNEMLKEEGLPIWVKKFDCALQRDGTYLLWANVKAINSGGKDMTMLSIPEYQATREQQPK